MIPFNKITMPPVTAAEMQDIYERIKTPYKLGAVMKMDGRLTDSPSVFYYEGAWYMYFISIAEECYGSGYESHIARSDDLIHWEIIETLFTRDNLGRWDSRQCAGYIAFIDHIWGGTNSPKRINGKYYMSYLGGGGDGYEPDPLFMGLACSDTPLSGFKRFEEPILRPDDDDIRIGEGSNVLASLTI